MKKIFTLFTILIMGFSLCSCGIKTTRTLETLVNPNAPAHEQLLTQAQNYVNAAIQAENMGVGLQGAYYYGLAQASVSSLRYAIDNILWLMGEGETFADVIGNAPYQDWNSIVEAGMSSALPYYFEGLIFEIQGKDDEAQICYEYAKANPNYKESDFWYLRNMSVDELYALRETVLTMELSICESYTPRTSLCSKERTGAEFSPVYHLTLAKQASSDGYDQLAWECALNALLTNPTEASLYIAAAGYGLTAEVEEVIDIVNEGLYVFPENDALNYLAMTISISAGNQTQALEFFKKLQALGNESYISMGQELLDKASTQ